MQQTMRQRTAAVQQIAKLLPDVWGLDAETMSAS
jgi:hypothetical protein